MINDDEIKRIIENEVEGPNLDYKESISLNSEKEKAEFVKDIISLANSGSVSHLIIGIEDETRKLIGIENHYKLERINQILKDKTDPPIRVEYKELRIMGYAIGVIEIDGNNPPYIIAVPDKFGGITRGTVFVRNFNMNEGASRADLDSIYNKMKPIILESDIDLEAIATVKEVEKNTRDVTIYFKLDNNGDALATDAYLYVKIPEVMHVVRCNKPWHQAEKLREGVARISGVMEYPIVKGVTFNTGNFVIRVDEGLSEVIATILIAATNMRTKEGKYNINIGDITEATD